MEILTEIRIKLDRAGTAETLVDSALRMLDRWDVAHGIDDAAF